MGQALKRAAGRVRTPAAAPPAPAKSAGPHRPAKSAEPHRPAKSAEPHRPANTGDPRLQTEYNGVLEERDPGFDAMLSKMAGRITSKPAGKLEMGEALIVEKYNRPMPKLRNTKAGAEQAESRAPPPGTLDIAKLKELLLAHQEISNDPRGAIDSRRLAEKFKIDTEEIEKVLQHVSLPQDNTEKKRKDNP